MTDSNTTLAIASTFAFSVVAVLVLSLVVGASLQRPAAAGPAPGCAEWTDSCVVCRRLPDGLACSTPGIACVRGPVQCLQRDDSQPSTTPL